MRRALSIPLLTVAIASGSASAGLAQTPPPEERIRAGVTVSGVDVGNLTVAEATAKLEQTLGPLLAQDVVVTAARRRFTLKMSQIRFDFRADRTALRALYAGRENPPAPDGSLPPASAEPSIAYRRGPVWRFAKRSAKAVGVAPRDARVRITLTRMIRRKGRKGRKLPMRALVKSIQATVEDPLAT